MLILVKTKDGIEKAINIANAEFEASPNPQDASTVNLIIRKDNGEVVESTISEESYSNLINALRSENKLIPLS